MSRIAIIGAGIAGLSAARALGDDYNVTLFDKSRGVGGRMSTRYAGDYEFDHGAQYFTITDPRFQGLIDGLAQDGDAARWDSRGLYLKDGEVSDDTGRARWVGAPRMNSIPKAMANGLDIRLGARVARITGRAGNIMLAMEDGTQMGPYDRVICTAPAPQAAALMSPRSLLQTILSDVKMSACFALMVGLPMAGPQYRPGFDSLRASDLPISWIAVNSAKPGRGANHDTLVIHASPEWSDTYAEADRVWVEETLLECGSALLGLQLHDAPHIALHRWLYAFADEGTGQDCLVDERAGVVLAGDWCVGGRVEGAVVSGLAAASAIRAQLP